MTEPKQAEILAAYGAGAEALAARFETVTSEHVLGPVADFLPDGPANVLDVGAGSGRDAAWFATRGARVWAAEPVGAMREAGQGMHPSSGITWLDDGLPDLNGVKELGIAFDLVLVNAVWHHLPLDQRVNAIAALAAVLKPEGRLILSLRDGPGDPSRPAWPGDVEGTVALAAAHGLKVQHRTWVEAVQPDSRSAGVIFTWLVCARG